MAQINISNYYQIQRLTLEDKKALEMFDKHHHEFYLDRAPKFDPYDEAKRFNEKYFKGTPYSVEVDEYCCYCTVSVLCKTI